MVARCWGHSGSLEVEENSGEAYNSIAMSLGSLPVIISMPVLYLTRTVRHLLSTNFSPCPLAHTLGMEQK